MRNSVSFLLNGVRKEVSGKAAFLPLSSYLRYDCALTGTKVVCAEGDCGACTIMVAKWQPDAPPHYQGINSCIAMTFAMDGASLVTVEGLAGEDGPNEIQCSMVRNFGGQCGFCTPGFVMAIANMYEQNSEPTLQSAKNYLTGNLCRCTGYTPILTAALDVDVNKHVLMRDKFPPQRFAEELLNGVRITTEDAEYFAPTTLAEACRYKAENSDVVVFSGSTDLGVQFNKGHLTPRLILSLHLIPELYKRGISGHGDERVAAIGARVTLAEFQQLIAKEIPSLNRFLNIFASAQIKNAGTLVGNLANASPIADMTPVLMALDADVHIQNRAGVRVTKLQNFYLGYKKTDLGKDEIITQISFKIPEKNQTLENYKVSQRRDLDISTVNASFNFRMNGSKIASAKIALGGVGPTTLRMIQIEKSIEGTELNEAKLDEIKKLIVAGIQPLSDMRGSAAYRSLLAANLFERFAREQLSL